MSATCPGFAPVASANAAASKSQRCLGPLFQSRAGAQSRLSGACCSRRGNAIISQHGRLTLTASILLPDRIDQNGVEERSGLPWAKVTKKALWRNGGPVRRG